MTREEAIEILWRYDVNFEPHPPEEVMHAIDMAIEALSAEPSKSTDQNVADVPSGDLISREEAIEIIASHDETNGTEKVFTGREITDLLASLPSSDRPQVNSAEWVEQKEREFEELHRPKEDSKPQPYVHEASTERVVHCKDCIYSEEVRDGNDMFACNNINGMPGYVRGDDFCSSGSL